MNSKEKVDSRFPENGKLDGRLWVFNKWKWNDLSAYICCVSKEDNEKYKLNGVEMFGDNTYIVEFNENEFQNWNRTKLMDQMLNEQTR